MRIGKAKGRAIDGGILAWVGGRRIAWLTMASGAGVAEWVKIGGQKSFSIQTSTGFVLVLLACIDACRFFF